jgi:hypothetical protein
MPATHDERGGDGAALCSTSCDPDCDAVCHEDHVEGHKKRHWPYECLAADRYFDEYFRGADGFAAEVIKRLRGERDDARQLLAAVTARAEKAEGEAERLRSLEDSYIVALDQMSIGDVQRLRERAEKAEAERDEARELARASLDILRNVSDEPMRELFEVDDMAEMPAWFTGYGDLKPGDAKGADATPDGRSATEADAEPSKASGVELEFGKGTAGPSEAELCPSCGNRFESAMCQARRCWELGATIAERRAAFQDDDTTEDGQHG